ncbi:MAG TPA: heavy metal translocating P-type ATPase [Humisphaera sp.]|jgi:Cu+-exporting ATPase|nr:heavy metal translocating P-type ATPase [Humisphaera sp.]
MNRQIASAAPTPIILHMTATASSLPKSGSSTLDVAGMNCASCVSHVETAARRVAGVEDCRVNLATGRAAVRFDPARTAPDAVARAITDSGYPATIHDGHGAAESADAQRHRDESHAWAWRALVGVLLWLPIETMHWIGAITAPAHHAMAAQSMPIGWAAFITGTLAIVLVGSRFYASAWKALRHATTNMDTLISIGASVAYGYSLVYFLGGLAGVWSPPASNDLYFMEASGLLALISMGHWLEARARKSAGDAIGQLLELAPSIALRLRDTTNASAEVDQVPVRELEVGDRILIRPGDKVAADGVVIDGCSNVDESMITGEPIPAPRGIGDNLIGGTVNQDGRLIVRVTRVGSETALAQIVKLVENAQTTKPPVQRLADRVSAVFVPTVLVIALITGIAWYIFGSRAGWSAAHVWSGVAQAVCSVLIIACPCALGLAVPAAVMVGTGLGARHGILIRDIDAIQKAENVEMVVLDKTGTVTRGQPTVSKIVLENGSTEDEVLRLAASAELFSSHPLAKAIVAAARQRKLQIPEPSGFENDAGFGVVATVDGATILAGNPELLIKHGGASQHAPASNDSAQTEVVIARRTIDSPLTTLGTIIIADQIKADSQRAIESLHGMGLKTMLLTGDRQSAAETVAREVGIRQVRAQVKPHEKAAVIEALQGRTAEISNLKSQISNPKFEISNFKSGTSTSRIAMVGDGINDAPALATADLGIAIGGGSDIAKEAGDIVLVSGSLAGVPAAIRLSRATMSKIRQNLFLAFIYNILAIPIAAGVLYPAFGLRLSPLIAAGAMALSDISVIGNALLLRRTKLD